MADISPLLLHIAIAGPINMYTHRLSRYDSTLVTGTLPFLLSLSLSLFLPLGIFCAQRMPIRHDSDTTRVINIHK